MTFTKIKKRLSRLKANSVNKMTNIKNNAQNAVQEFKSNFSEAKSKPISKRKSLSLGFTIVLGIFGVTLLGSVLPAIAKDIPVPTKKPGEVCPAPSDNPALVPSQEIVGALAGVAATVGGLAVSSGPFMIGALCGLVVVVGILKAMGR